MPRFRSAGALRRRDVDGKVTKWKAPFFGVDVYCKVTAWNRKAVEIAGNSKYAVMVGPLIEELVAGEFRRR